MSRKQAPTKSQLDAAIADDVSPYEYKHYFKPFFDHLYSLNGEVTTYVELYDQSTAGVSRSRYREFLKKCIEYDPEIELLVVGYVFHVDAFIKQSAAAHNFSDIGTYINRIQQTCLQMYWDSKDEYVEKLINYLRRKTESQYQGQLNSSVSPDVLNDLLNEFESELAVTLPEKITSINQSGKNMAGSVNEELFLLSLESAGLTRDADFEQISSKNDTGDIKVHYKKAGNSTFRIEAKSSKNRERGEFGVGAVQSPSGLIGFFDNADEIITASGKLEKQCQVVYLPSKTLSKIARSDDAVYSMNSQKNGELFLRANNEYGIDMKYYHKHGRLPSKSVGHESKYLTATWGT